jgi:hypothetical protein
MSSSERAEFVAMRNLPDDNAYDWEMMDGVMDGTEQIDVSHTGGEFKAVLQNMEEEIQLGR